MTTAEKILDELKGRLGFSEWWESQDEETQGEIMGNIEALVDEHAKGPWFPDSMNQAEYAKLMSE